MIEAVSLEKNYGTLRAVQGVSFTVERGEILGFLGPNGAGKSTTMKMITGFLPPSAGTARIGDHDVQEEPIAAKRLLGYLPESGPLYPEMTVREFLHFAADMRELKGPKRVAALDRVTSICHLEGVIGQPIETLSKGFRQRVGMAQAILHEPPCLILDEPTDGLDPNQKKAVRDLIASMAGDKAIILSTHILEEVEAMCSRVIIVAKGKIIADETPEALLRRHPDFGALRLVLAPGTDPAPIREALGKLPAISAVRPGGEGETDETTLHLFPRKGENLFPVVWENARQNAWPLTRLEALPLRLDTVFHRLTQTAPAP
jgi:ABC-2 type transport system ATP-binding protein